MKNLKILLAVSTPELHGLMMEILHEHRLCIVTTVDQAIEAFHPELDLIICGLHFDMGRMYELLQYAKYSPKVKNIPVLTVQLTGGILPYGVFKSMECAFQLLGGDLLVQVDKWRIEMGDEPAFARLREVVETIQVRQNDNPHTLRQGES
ncbi:MAG: hypothetical protein ACO1NO_00140 [Burkholderiaceae bacterium]